jgi:hypothetical protein
MKGARAPRRAPGIDVPLLLGILFFLLVAAPSALAWGPSVHLWVGERLLDAAIGALPAAAALLRRNPKSFLYGSIAPDFEVGKGSRGHATHNHNWTTGQRVLDRARGEEEEAFALGYMAHLAADVIGHNHFVPNHLYRSFGSRKLGHALWEVHADNLVGHHTERHVGELVTGDFRKEDALLHKVTQQGLIPLSMKRRLFSGFLRLQGSVGARMLLRAVRGHSERALRYEDVRGQIELSLGCAVEMLANPSVPMLGRFDPIGAKNIHLAKDVRSQAKKARSYEHHHVPFPVPPELTALSERLTALRPQGKPSFLSRHP